MRKVFGILCVLTLFSGAVFAERSAAVQFSAAEPVLDGKLDEPCWQDGGWQGDFVMMNDSDRAAEQTSFKVVNTPRGIYLGIRCEDKNVVSRSRKHDESVWHDDSVEILIAPVAEFPADENVREVAHFIVNADGCRFDGYMTAGIDEGKWDPFWSAAGQRTAEGFTLEVLLPFSLFSDRDLRAGRWRFNLLRTHKGGKVTLYSLWNPARSVRDTAHYGVLEPVRCDTERFRVQPSAPRFRKAVVNGAARTVLEADFKVRNERPFKVAAMIYSPEKSFANFADGNFQSDAAGDLRAVLPADFRSSGDCTVRLAVFDEEGKIFDRTWQVAAKLAPLELTVLHPVYRNTLYASDPDRKLRAELKIDLPQLQREQSVLKIRLADASGKVLDEKSVPSPPERFEYASEIGKDTAGVLTLEAGVGDAQELKLTHRFQVMPPRGQGSEVYLASSGNLMVDGREFFVRGFMGGYKDFDDMVNAGCNTVHFYTLDRQEVPEILERLDRCREKGLYAVFGPYHKSSVGFFGVRRGGKDHPRFTEEELERMRRMVTAVKDHPALLGWYTFDEPRGSEWIEELHKVYRLLAEIDPMHPVFGSDNGAASCIDLQNCCDVIMLDMYLNPALNGEPLRPVSMILNSVERVARHLRPGKMLIYVPQAYDVDSFMPQDFVRQHRPPTREESAATVFGALAAGARGILAYKIGNKVLLKPGVRHSNAGIYADEELRRTYLEYLMPALKREENFFLIPGPVAPAVDHRRVLVRTMPDGKARSMSVGETKDYEVEFHDGK